MIFKNHLQIFIITVTFVSATAMKESFPNLTRNIIAAAALRVLSFCTTSKTFLTFTNEFHKLLTAFLSSFVCGVAEETECICEEKIHALPFT